MKAFFSISALACLFLGTMAGAESLDFSGQGLPRMTEADCRAAGKSISSRLKALGFEHIELSCAGTNQDVGGFVPVVRARHAHRYQTEQAIGGRVATIEACKKSLAKLQEGIAADDLVESECLRGTETDYRGRATDFYQPWLTKLVLSSDERRSSVESERRENKPVEPGSTPAAHPQAASGASQRPTSN